MSKCMNHSKQSADELAIARLVSHFYERAREHPLLEPIFTEAVADWDVHLRIIEDFWSRTLLGTERYKGHPYPIHAQLPLKPEHFTVWLELFRASARETLSPEHAEQAIGRAEHMAESFQAGMFAFPPYHGPKIWKPA